MPSKNIVWLASYPKSGNTWVRALLANYLLGRDAPVPINEIHQIALGDALLGAYQRVARAPFDPADERRTLSLRTAVLEALAGKEDRTRILKTHNQNVTLGGVRLIPPHLTRLAIYVVRNPLDLVLSYADHYGMPLAVAAEAISAPANRIVPDATNVTQYLGTWSDHVKSWTRERAFPLVTVRYEDMKADPAGAFREILRRLGAPIDEARLERAVEFSSFGELRRQEDKAGFRERSRHAERFFRSGEAGQWAEKLPEKLVERISTEHGTVMKRFGYLP